MGKWEGGGGRDEKEAGKIKRDKNK